MKLKCWFCRYPRRTNKLWLVTLFGTDYLVCERHRSLGERNVRDNNKKQEKVKG